MATAIPLFIHARHSPASGAARAPRPPLLEPQVDPGLFLSLPPQDETSHRHECRREAHEHVEEP
jgi:hypothetical protein